MSNNLTNKVQSPVPEWTSLQEPKSTNSDEEILEGPRPKKRKNGEGLDVHGRDDFRSSVKRPRHSVSGPVISGTSKSGQTSFGSATDSVPKPSTAPTSPNRSRSASSSAKQAGSTASNLAALYQSSIPQHHTQQRNIDPFIEKWREEKRAIKKQPRREMTTRTLVSEKKQQMERVNNPKNPYAKMIGNLNRSGFGSGPRSAALEEKTQARGASEKDGHFPIRQFARKTVGGSGPPKKHFFDRQVTSISGNASDGSLSSGSDTSLVSSSANKVAQVQPPKPRKQHASKSWSSQRFPLRQHARKGLGLQRPTKEQQVTTIKRRNTDPEVIVIDSSDESITTKAPRKPRPNQNPITRGFAPGVSKRIERPKGRETHKKSAEGGRSHDLPAAIDQVNQTSKGKEKSLVEDIIDLTLDDSDETPSSGQAVPRPEQTPSSQARSEEVVPILPGSAKVSPTNQAPGSPPIEPPILPSTPMKDYTRCQTIGAVVSSPSKDEPGLRSRSMPVSTGPDLPMAAETSRFAASPQSVSSHEDAPAGFARLSREKRITWSPNETVSDSDAKEEREVYKAVLQDANMSSSEAHNIDEDEALVPAMRTNSSSPDLMPPLHPPLRAGSASSRSEMDNLALFTDAESPPDSSPSPGPEEPVVALTYGGFKALTWEDHKKDFKNLGLTHYSAKDLPTALPDSINRLSEYTRMDQGLRDVFQAYMLENIADDEASAPDVEIINNIDLEPTPLFEFVYSNRIWYGEGVPLPDYSKLKGCGCIGKCDPRSKTCLCAQRQREYCDTEDGCVYDRFGRLKHPGYPIFECNELCSCDDECRNRVVQHGRKYQVSITKTEKKGWGVFNGSKRIPTGSFIGIYAGELLTDDSSEFRGRYYDKIGKTYLFDVDFWHLKPHDNSEDWHNKYTVDAYHAGNFTRFLNHSCDPNARLYPCYINEPDIEKPLLVVFSIRDIEPYDEICFNYMGRYSEEDDDEVEDEVEKRLDPVYAICRCGAKNCVGKFF